MQNLKPGKYKHSKSGKMYNVIGVGKHSESLEDLVIYQSLYDSIEFGENALWVRPLAMFIEDVEIDGKILPRFQYIND